MLIFYCKKSGTIKTASRRNATRSHCGGLSVCLIRCLSVQSVLHREHRQLGPVLQL